MASGSFKLSPSFGAVNGDAGARRTLYLEKA